MTGEYGKYCFEQTYTAIGISIGNDKKSPKISCFHLSLSPRTLEDRIVVSKSRCIQDTNEKRSITRSPSSPISRMIY